MSVSDIEILLKNRNRMYFKASKFEITPAWIVIADEVNKKGAYIAASEVISIETTEPVLSQVELVLKIIKESGNAIDAIKRLRTEFGLSLKEAKRLYDDTCGHYGL